MNHLRRFNVMDSFTKAAAGCLLLVLALAAACGPSRQQKVQAVFERHKEAFVECEKLTAEAHEKLTDVSKRYLAGEASSASVQDFQHGVERSVGCTEDLRKAIQSELQSQGLAEAPEVNQLWSQYTERAEQSVSHAQPAK